ncbi:MAG: DsrE family protein [Metallosphaera sp.]
MKLGIILGSNELDRVAYAGMHALIAASLDNEVVIFATMDGVKAFLKDPELKVSGETSKVIKEQGENVFEHFKKAKKSGKLKILACSYASKIHGLDKDKYSDLVDDVVGITSFSLEVEGSQIITVW